LLLVVLVLAQVMVHIIIILIIKLAERKSLLHHPL
jgi:hypothetical protein